MAHAVNIGTIMMLLLLHDTDGKTCNITEAYNCMKFLPGVNMSPDNSPDPVEMCRNYTDFKACWDPKASMCSQSSPTDYIQYKLMETRLLELNLETVCIKGVPTCSESEINKCASLLGSDLSDVSHVSMCSNYKGFKKCWNQLAAACTNNEQHQAISEEIKKLNLDYMCTTGRGSCSNQEIRKCLKIVYGFDSIDDNDFICSNYAAFKECLNSMECVNTTEFRSLDNVMKKTYNSNCANGTEHKLPRLVLITVGATLSFILTMELAYDMWSPTAVETNNIRSELVLMQKLTPA